MTLAEVIALCTELLLSFVKAGEDAAKQEDALMTAEETLAASRAKKKFG